MNNSADAFVTIISGVPRSGTSMMMQMLEAGGMPVLTDNERSADEDNRKGYYELEAVKRTTKDASWLTEAPGRAVKVIYMLLYDLPADYRYRVLFVHRRLEEVLASQQEMLKRRGEKGADLPPERMKAIFERQLEKVHDWLSEQQHFELLSLNYHDVLADPQQHAGTIAEFLGAGLNVESMANAVDRKLYRQKQG
jgi:hypothetical protein